MKETKINKSDQADTCCDHISESTSWSRGRTKEAMALTLVLAIFSAVLGMFQFGYNMGVINSVSGNITEFINETYISEDNQDGFSDEKLGSLFSVAVAVYLLGGMIGALLGGYVADKFGRKRGIIYVQVCL